MRCIIQSTKLQINVTLKAQYMCTDIGDISDEGKSRKITDSELSSMDSLLGKLGAPEETVQKNDQVQDMGKKTSSSTEQN